MQVRDQRVLLGLALPAGTWKQRDAEITAICAAHRLKGVEIHTAWMLRRYPEQERIADFAKMNDTDRRAAVEVRELDNQFIVTAELPGLKKDDVDIEYQNGVLFIRGEKVEESHEEKRNLLVWERQYGSFQRSFMLPNTIDQDKILAEFNDGILTITLPKTEAAKTQAPASRVGGRIRRSRSRRPRGRRSTRRAQRARHALRPPGKRRRRTPFHRNVDRRGR